MTEQTFTFNQTEIKEIQEFANKYPDSMCVEVTTTTGSGIGQLVSASVATYLNEDWVTITKTITSEKSW
jgi:hypothetical protein